MKSKEIIYFFEDGHPQIATPFGLKLKKELVSPKGISLFETIYGHMRENWIALKGNELYIYLNDQR